MRVKAAARAHTRSLGGGSRCVRKTSSHTCSAFLPAGCAWDSVAGRSCTASALCAPQGLGALIPPSHSLKVGFHRCGLDTWVGEQG